MAGRRHPPDLRAEAVRRVESGRPAPVVAAELDVPLRTVQLWVRKAAPPKPTPEPLAPEPEPRPSLNVVPMPPREERDDSEAEALVEAAVGRGWSLGIRRKLATALGLSLDQVDGLRARVVARAAAQWEIDHCSPEEYAEHLLQIRWGMGTAAKASDLTAFGRLLSQWSRVRGYDKVQVQVEHSGAVELRAVGPEEITRRRQAVRARLLALPGGADEDSG